MNSQPYSEPDLGFKNERLVRRKGMEDRGSRTEDLDAEDFITRRVAEIAEAVGDGCAINALSGGVDSAVVTLLGHKALGPRLKTYIIDNALMRKDEPQEVVQMFKDLGVPIILLDARREFLDALKGITDPEEKREAVTQTFYKKVFGHLVRESKARYLLQGTILTDVDETVAGIKRQHNVFAQLGIDPEVSFGYKILEPLVQIRKDGVRKVGKALGLPEAIFNRIPFPGPALAARIIGEVTAERLQVARLANAVVESELMGCGAFQYMAILHEDRVTGIREGKRDFGMQIEVRCWDSLDAREATPTRLSFDLLTKISFRLTQEVPGVVSVTYNISSKPPSTMEAI